MTPYFSSVSDLLHMDGHGSFVWACYGITFVAIFLLIIFVKNERKSTISKLTRQSYAKGHRDRLTNKQRQQQL
ncbi:heme exporter protein CcmD [Moraxella nasovis]|uniref:heme exporter protein CcmD n=1 Tax=Moraxella nasovis TaxID=2904121 RepID=UPI001F61C9E5|nr:heme exporter protein CcmD [Moraxella nasovis]UNU74001.1 heme exporter protein CcmD [Moraxella nasovis]